jgi:hypothetical protein
MGGLLNDGESGLGGGLRVPDEDCAQGEVGPKRGEGLEVLLGREEVLEERGMGVAGEFGGFSAGARGGDGE